MTDDQSYYWTEEWQAGERESLAEIAAGNVQRFATGAEAVRYLSEPDDS